MNTGQIANPSIRIKPSKKLREYVSTVKVSSDPPVGIANLIFKNPVKNTTNKIEEFKLLLTDEDRQFLTGLDLNSKIDITQLPLEKEAIITDKEKLLNIQDLHWLFQYIQTENEHSQDKVYLHELMEGSYVVLPENSKIPRNAELEKRCEKLRASQQNLEYSNMTKNVDSIRKRHPEDTISYQSKKVMRIKVFG